MMRSNPEQKAEVRRIGVELNQVDRAIYTSKVAIKDLLAIEPVDEQAVLDERLQMYDARRQRNELRGELNRAKLRQWSFPLHQWTVTGIPSVTIG